MMMDIDPVDDGPVLARRSASTPTTAAIPATTVTPTRTDEARQCIDGLRSDDVAQRVAAAHRLDVVALALGPERTRSVRL